MPRLQGAFWGVLAGQATGVTRLVLDFVYPAPDCGHEDTRPLVVAKLHFTYFSIVVMAVTAIVALLVSLTRPRQSDKQVGVGEGVGGGEELQGCCSVSVEVVVGCHRGAVGQLEQAATVRDAGRRG